MSRYMIPMILLGGTLVLGFLIVSSPAPTRQGASLPKKGPSLSYGQVQQLRQETAIKVGIRKQQAQMARRLNGPDLDPNYRQRNKFHQTDLASEESRIAGDLDDRVSEGPLTLDQKMDEFLAKKQEYEELAASKRKAYVQSFVQEAYRMGFIVTVNSNLEVTEVKKVPTQ